MSRQSASSGSIGLSEITPAGRCWLYLFLFIYFKVQVVYLGSSENILLETNSVSRKKVGEGIAVKPADTVGTIEHHL